MEKKEKNIREILSEMGLEIGKELVKIALEEMDTEQCKKFSKHLKTVIFGFSFVLGFILFYWFIFISPYFDKILVLISGFVKFFQILYPFSLFEKFIFLISFSLVTSFIFVKMVEEKFPKFKFSILKLVGYATLLFPLTLIFMLLIDWIIIIIIKIIF